MADELETRVREALDKSTDGCARCKVCDGQVRAVMGVIEDVTAGGRKAEAELSELRGEAERLRKLVRMLENGGQRVGFCVVTYNQASHCPGFDYPDLHTSLEDAVNERDYKREETKGIGRGERHVVAEVTEMAEEDDG